MSAKNIIPAGLSLEGISGDARAGFEVAGASGYRGIAFATNHQELNPEALGESGRRHLRTILAGKGLGIESVRAAAPRGGLVDASTIDRTLDNVRRAVALARELGVETVGVNIGALSGLKSAADKGDTGVGEETIVAALREMAQQADVMGVKLAVGAESAGEALGRILKRVDFEGARVNLDTARVVSAGEDPMRVAEMLGGSGMSGGIGQVTAADVVRAGNKVRATYLGEGQVAMEELMAVLREMGFDGPVVVDVRDLADGRMGAERAAEVLRRVFAR